MTERMMSKKRSRILFAMILTVAVSAVSPLFAADSKNVLKTYNEAVEFQNEENWYTASQYYIEVVMHGSALQTVLIILVNLILRFSILKALKNTKKINQK